MLGIPSGYDCAFGKPFCTGTPSPTAYQISSTRIAQLRYHRGEIERILYSREHPQKTVYLILVFLFPEHDPKTEPWFGFSRAGSPYFRVLYFEELLRLLAARDPDHPLLLVFRPITEKDDERLMKSAGTYHRTLREADLEPEVQDALLEAFESWLLSRFRHMTHEEVRVMLSIADDVRETVAYKGFKEEGREEGRLLGALETLENLFTQGLLTEKDYLAQTQSIRARLEALRRPAE